MFALIATALLAAPPPVPVSPWVTVKGQVVWPQGKEIPDPAAINVFSDKQFCCGAGPLFDESVVIDRKTRGIQGVVVWLRPDDTKPQSFFPKDRIHPDLAKVKPKEHTIEMPRCQFVPRILAARAGDVLLANNAAPIAHNLCLQGTANETNRILPLDKGSLKVVETLKVESSPIPFKDNIHPWMTGYLRVFDHPYFAVTDAAGRFEIPLVPVGKWRFVYWHERGYHQGRDGRFGFPVAVTDNGAGKQSLSPIEYSPPKPD